MVSNEMPLTPLPLDKFTYDRKKGTLVAEASDFGPARDGRWWLQRLYNDAADSGIAIRSHRTNAVIRCYLDETETREGDTLAWHFRPVPGQPAANNIHKVTILND